MSAATAADAALEDEVGGMEQPTWVNFSLGEDVRDQRRLEQDRRWAAAVSDGRVHLSNREFALLYGHRFRSAIDDYHLMKVLVSGLFQEDCVLNKLNELLLSIIVEFAYPGQSTILHAVAHQRQVELLLTSPLFQLRQKALSPHFRVCLRKRPIFPEERAMGAYDVTSLSARHQALVLHEGKLARNGRLLSMTHHHFAFDHIFNDRATNDDVCREAVEPLLQRALDGFQSTLLCFGQTGTGKTFTLYGALHYLSHRLVGHRLRVRFFEVHGKQCYDLLQRRKQVQLRFDAQETPRVRGSHMWQTESVQSPEQLLAVLEEALALRSSLVTERNPISSRSHAVCVLELLQPPADDASTVEGSVAAVGAEDDREVHGRLTLVDLAGSERNYETTQMSAAVHRESADINLALMSLKNCFHAYHQCLELQHLTQRSDPDTSSIRIPYRDSTLTKVLKNCFFSSKQAAHFTTIIATISPTPVDLLHSLNTVQHVLLMSPTLAEHASRVSVEVPKTSLAALSSVPIWTWTHEQVLSWVSTVERGRFAHLVLPRQFTGQELCEVNVDSVAELFAQAERHGRRGDQGEGPAWVISTAPEADAAPVAAPPAAPADGDAPPAATTVVQQNTRPGRLRQISHAFFLAVRREMHFYHQHDLDKAPAFSFF